MQEHILKIESAKIGKRKIVSGKKGSSHFKEDLLLALSLAFYKLPLPIVPTYSIMNY